MRGEEEWGRGRGKKKKRIPTSREVKEGKKVEGKGKGGKELRSLFLHFGAAAVKEDGKKRKGRGRDTSLLPISFQLLSAKKEGEGEEKKIGEGREKLIRICSTSQHCRRKKKGRKKRGEGSEAFFNLWHP